MWQIFKKKDLDDILKKHESSQTLKRSLGPIGLIIMGIGAIIGAGIFIVTGVASATSGPALIISFIIAAVACTFTALCYAEFASLIPITGSVYTYTYVTMGEIWAWMIGWIVIFEYLLAASSVAVGWSSYATGLLGSIGMNLPLYLTNPPSILGGFINLPALLIVVILTAILLKGAHESARFNTIVVFIKLLVILIFITVGINFIKPGNYQPFIPYGWTGVFQGAAMVFFAYIGFDAVASAAEEAKDPQRTIPMGIIGSLIISSILYIAVAIVMTGMVPYYLFAGTGAPVSFALQQVGVDWALAIVSIGAIAGLTTVILINLFGQTRITYAMSRDGLIPQVFSKVHHNFKSPIASIILVGVVAAIVAAFFPLQDIFELVNIGALSAFIFLALSIIILRWQRPDLPRKFKCPLVPLIPILSILLCLGLITQLSTTTIEEFLFWIIIGLVIYFLYGKHRGLFSSEQKISLNKENYPFISLFTGLFDKIKWSK